MSNRVIINLTKGSKYLVTSDFHPAQYEIIAPDYESVHEWVKSHCDKSLDWHIASI